MSATAVPACPAVCTCTCCLQEALSSALCMFNTAASSCSTDDDQRVKLAAWVNFAAGVKPSLQLVCERIMRREAEAALALRDCVQQAKACVLEEVDLQELLQAMAGCGSTDAAGDVFEVCGCLGVAGFVAGYVLGGGKEARARGIWTHLWTAAEGMLTGCQLSCEAM